MGEHYTYDGWGNLLSKAVFKGTAPVYSTTIDPATNGGPGQEAAPGNPALDVERRMLTSNGVPGYVPYLSYDPSGQRIFKETPRNSMNPNSQTTCEIYFYGITGQKLATYGCHYSDQENGDGNFYADLLGRNEYFAGKPIKLNGVAVVTDRLGSVRWNGNGERFNYYPYGEERGTTANGREKFGTYFRDTTGLDYADQRYYDSTKGRFTTPDPYRNSAGAADPGSWNRYLYVQGDAINHYDPLGLDSWDPNTNTLHGDANAVDPGAARDAFFAAYASEPSQQQLVLASQVGGHSGLRPVRPKTDAEMRDELMKGLHRAGDILNNNSECAGLFGGGPYPSAITVLSRISNSFEFAAIPNKTNPDKTITVTSATTTANVPGVQYGSTTVYSSVTIVLNNTSAGASFVSGNIDDWAVTILHELGHASLDLYGYSQITPDGGNTAASEANTALIKQKCKL